MPKKTLQQLKIIYEMKYALNKSESKFISIGIDVENWVPMLKISGSNGIGIPLSCEDWETITNDINIKKIDNFFKNGSMEPIEMNGSGLRVTGQQFNQKNVLNFKSTENYYVVMAEVSIRRLFEISTLIDMRKKEIEGLDMHDHYTDVLFASIQLGGVPFNNFKAIASSLGQFQPINLYCMLEMFLLFPEIINKNLYDLVSAKF